MCKNWQDWVDFNRQERPLDLGLGPFQVATAIPDSREPLRHQLAIFAAADLVQLADALNIGPLAAAQTKMLVNAQKYPAKHLGATVE